MYLPEPVVHETLRCISKHSVGGSSLAMEYVSSGAIGLVQKYPIGPIKCAVEWGEPWIFGVPDDRDREFFAETGLELVHRISLNSLDTVKKYAFRRDGTFYGAHLMEAFKARGEQMMSQMPAEDRALAARWGYFIAELKVQ